MKNYLFLTLALILFAPLFVAGQTTCDDFDRANSTSVDGWTEQVGDWSINNNSLQSPSATTWNFITYNGSTQADGCISGRLTHNGIPGTQFMGLVARYTSTSSYIMIKIQDNNSTGHWDSYYINCNGNNISYVSSGLNFGTDINVQFEYTGPNVIVRIDADRNGTWDYTYTGTVTTTTAGLCGAGSFAQCYLDDWCYGTSCCTAAPDPAGTISGSPVVCVGQNGVNYSVPVISGATSYVWTYSGTGATVNGTGNSITINFSGAATSGTLTVYGTNSCGNGTPSNAYQITVDPCTGMQVASVASNIRISPDPGQGRFTVQMESDKDMNNKLRIFNVTGSAVYTADRQVRTGMNLFEIDLTDEPSGIYYLEILNDQGRTVKPLMISR